MTLFKTLLGFLAVTFIVISCKKELSKENGKTPEDTESTWRFVENSQEFKGNMDSASFQSTAGFTALTMTGSRNDNQSGEIILQIAGSEITTTTYNSAQIFFQYAEGGDVIYQTIPGQAGDFSITVDEIDSLHISGTFSGTAYDASSGEHQIVEGTFTAPMAAGNTPVPPQDGQLTVWAKEICSDGGSIEISVADQKGFITEPTPAEPGCSAAGSASFTLPQGSYTVTAVCGTDTLTYTVNVNAACVKLLVDFSNPPLLEDYLPLTHGSYWDYKDLVSETTTQRATSTIDTAIDGRQYTMVINTLPDTFYYRKDQNIYYQYVTLDFNGYVQNPPSFEMVILRDDYQAGQTWESPPIDINLSGVSVKAKLSSTIIQRDFSADIGGVTYDSIIHVNTKILFSSDGGITYSESGSEYNQLFAKGKGIVYYDDLDRSIGWGAYAISIVP